MPDAPVLDRSQRAEQARAARRDEILSAARRVFAERGFRGTTIADIAEEAGIALGTIYLYFASKEEVFAALNQQLQEMIVATLMQPSSATTLEDTVRTLVGNVFDVCAGNRDLIRLVVLNTDRESEVTKRLRAADDQRVRPITETLTRAMEQGQVRIGDACAMTKLITGLVSIALYQAFVVEDGKGAATYRDMCADMIAAYLRPVTEE